MATKRVSQKSSISGVSTSAQSRLTAKPAKPTRVEEGQFICPICLDPIVEAVGKKAGDDAIECDGSCATWLHRCCAGLTKEAYLAVSKLPNPFFCPHCRLDNQELEIKALRETVGNLSIKLSAACDAITKLESSSAAANTLLRPSYANVAHSGTALVDPPNQVNTTTSAKSDGPSSANNSQLNAQRKFNVLIFGIKESNKGTHRHERHKQVMTNVGEVLSTIDPLVSETSICDCFRLGRFSDDKIRPVLVKLIRAVDVMSVLSNRRKLASLPGISIKPDLPPHERQVESLLLKERWSLIQNGVPKNSIKIKKNSIFVNNEKHGIIRNCEFHQIHQRILIMR